MFDQPKRKLAGAGPSDGSASAMASLLAELLHGATKTHMTHLKTESFAAHMALGGFYEELPDLVDGIAEQYQGVTEKLLDFPTVNVAPINTVEDAINYMRGLHMKVTELQEMCSYSEIINELDMVKSHINSAKYKLLFLH